MEGFIDRFGDEREVVRGWLSPGNAVDELEVLRNGVPMEIKEVAFFLPSENLAELKGMDARQFAVRLTRPISLLDTLAGTVEVKFTVGQNSKRISPSAGLINRERAELNGLLSRIDIKPTDVPKTSQFTTSAARSAPSNTGAPASGTILSPVGFPVGMTSPDGAVVLGSEGHFFPVGGANQILDRYRKGSLSSERNTDREVSEWLELIARRSLIANSKGVVFRQAIIPDKMSMLAHLSPYSVEPPTTAMQQLMNRTADMDQVVKFDDSIYKDANLVEKMWKKVDGHPTSFGAYVFSRSILESLNATLPELSLTDFDWPTFQEGPLGERFFGFPVWDTVMNVRTPEHHGLSPVPGDKLRGELGIDPSNPRIGIHFKYSNKDAPIDQVAVLVGTSTSGRGTHQSQLTWWIKQMFQELHFVWHTEFELDLLDEIQPDVVIGQTVERYLARTPLD